MELSEYKNIYDHEATHFFYQANHQLVLSLVQQYLPHSKKLKILDAGCGTGLLLQKLQQFGGAQGVDISPAAIDFCSQRKVKARVASLTKLPFKDNTFDVITCVDVLYHLRVKSDVQALRKLQRVLKPGGIVVLRVPANKWLKLAHDIHVHTRQRYTKNEVQQKLIQAQFKILKVSYVNLIFLVLAIVKYFFERVLKKKRVESGIETPPALVNSMLVKISQLELWWLRSHSLPFGLGVVAVGQKAA